MVYLNKWYIYESERQCIVLNVTLKGDECTSA